MHCTDFQSKLEFMNHFYHNICYKAHNTAFFQLMTSNSLLVPLTQTLGKTGPIQSPWYLHLCSQMVVWHSGSVVRHKNEVILC